MKKVLLLSLLSLLLSSIHAQIKAITETGDEVVLYNDGTWVYLGDEDTEPSIIPLNPEPFQKPATASFLLKSSRTPVGFWLDPKKWSFEKGEINADAEYQLQLRNGDLYGMVITEKVPIPIETLKIVALNNGRAVAPDLTIVKEEYRTVNDLRVLFLQMDGTIQGIEFSYYGYYYSDDHGSLQFLTYTSQNLLDEYRDTCDDLLNGLVVVEK